MCTAYSPSRKAMMPQTLLRTYEISMTLNLAWFAQNTWPYEQVSFGVAGGCELNTGE